MKDIARLRHKRERQGNDVRQVQYVEIEKEFVRKNKVKNKIVVGPKLKFQQYYKNYVETNLKGEIPTSTQKIGIAKAFFSEEGNAKLKEIYGIEDLLNWIPEEKSQGDDDGR